MLQYKNMEFKEYKNKIEEIKNWTQKEFGGIRTGAASIAILDNVSIQAYGSFMPINQLANLGVQDSKTILVTPFDKSISKDIERGLADANLGLSIAGTSDGVRLSFPDLTSERRVMLLKLAKEKLEDGKISIRKERDDIWKEIQQKEKDGEIGEDEKFSAKEQMEEITKNGSEQLDKIYTNKEEEISK